MRGRCNPLIHKPHERHLTMKQLDYILANETVVLEFLKSKYPLYHMSNVFFRDVQYGIQTMLYRKGMSVGYSDAEQIARAFVEQLEKKKILNPIDRQSWMLNHVQFKKPTVAPPPSSKPAAKTAGPAPAAARVPGAPAGAKPSLPPLGRAAGTASKPGGLPPLSRPAPNTPASKPGSLPPLNRAAAGTASAKPGGLPPMKSAAAPKPETPAQALKPLATETSTPAATDAPGSPEAPVGSSQPTAAKPVTQGERKPLPPLRSGKK